jgi:hypothetical protein
MFKRLAISFFLLLAFVLLQAHNFMPHHHESELIEVNHHHHPYESDEDQDCDLPFADLTHNADFGKIVVKPQGIKDIVEKPVFTVGLFIMAYNKLASLENPPEYHPPGDSSPLHLIFLSHSVPLRAPPAHTILS